MLALITGASSGIGRDMARVLSRRGYDLILVARRKDKLEELKQELSTNVQVIALDISSTFNCMRLYNKVKKENIDVLINNAGFGLFGDFSKTNLDQELDMIDLNMKTVHTLTKLFLKDFKEKNQGHILNVASSAGFMAGPWMATYYASKAYVLRLTEAISEELHETNSNVWISALCPGPVDTEFNQVAGVQFSIKGLKSIEVAEYAILKLFSHKRVIVPGFQMKCAVIASRFVPRNVLLRIASKNNQKKEQ